MTTVPRFLSLASAGLFLLAGRATAQAPADVSAIRDELMKEYVVWGKAQVAADRAAFDRMLAPDFEVRVGERRIARDAFLAQTAGGASRNASSPAMPRTMRFDSEILTLRFVKNEWVAVITEKIESVPPSLDGKETRAFTLGVTRDGWRKEGDRWLITFSEAVGTETWIGAKPPFKDW